ncbi:MAG: sn-glycerol-3-phosphate ABC transporter permease UgpE [Magnetococcales bacterium]|nr:sn-glycerol-3-phosphate ABC transporter permease UgpE [Magnetococcales bacterium]
MVENRPWLDLLTHGVLILGAALFIFPIYIAFVASSHALPDILAAPMPVWPGGQLLENYGAALSQGASAVETPVWVMLFNSLVMALGVAFGKITISILAAFGVVYFRFRMRMIYFWLIFLTLMLPVEVRILPTYEVVADLGLLDTRAGLIFPLVASATATFLFRQFFMTVPPELCEAARLDGASPMRFFFDILLPLARPSMAALFVITFVFGWNQYLWPLLVTTQESQYTILIGINRMLSVGDEQAQWQIIMATSMLALIPPVVVVLIMQRQFVRGLTGSDK